MRMESEWLECNGTGGFACGTVGGELRRKWHGLLWAARRPPRDRQRLLVAVEKYMRHPMMTLPLTATWGEDKRWVPPGGWPEFQCYPMPSWRWDLEGGGSLRETLFMPHGTTARLFLVYTFQPSAAQNHVRLSLRPLLTVEAEDRRLPSGAWLIANVEGTPLYLHANTRLEYARRGDVMEQVALELEKDCEDDHTEQLHSGPEFAFTVRGDAPVILEFSDHELPCIDTAAEMMETERERRLALQVPRLREEYAHLGLRLARAADQFIVHDDATGLSTILAGYPWFTDWGRDTMISLPGLALATGRQEEARAIMRHFLHYLNGGLIPNIFPEAGDPKYNTVDATLWLVEAYFRAFDEQEIRRDSRSWHQVLAILDAYCAGTHHSIGRDSDGLIHAGTPGTQLTWMDVKVNDEVPTPRHGKPVEIQGLWYNALLLVAEMADRLGDGACADRCRAMAEEAAASFAKRFVIPGQDHLADVVDRDAAGEVDTSLRPNMVLPFALRHNIIPAAARAGVLRAAARHLVTPRGLRSLAPTEAAYRGIYRGNVLARDRAYHQGTCWLWLIGPYVRGVEAEAAQVPELAEQLPAIRRELVYHFEKEACLDQANEIADADAPHRPRGCFAQAWSIAALIEVLGTGDRGTP